MRNLIVILSMLIVMGCEKPIVVPPQPSVNPSPSVVPSPEPEKDEPHLYKTGFKKFGPGLAKEAEFEVPEEKFLIPKSFDWRATAEVPVQNQGNCGSCWAFSTIASIDYAYAIYGSGGKFSEQELVDCAPYDGCGGGYFAGSWVLKNGIASEDAYPYKASDMSCKSKPEINLGKIISWKNVGQPNRKPAVKELKQAILQYGPISVDVAATQSWDYYDGKVKKDCHGVSINHMVTIVGWDGGGNWIMRNSWGTKWGNKGYALMPYGCDSIASDAAYVVIEQTRRKK